MRRILLNLSLLALVVTPLAAHAKPTAGTDYLTFTETSGGANVYSFLLPASPTSLTTDNVNYFQLTNIPFSTNGGAASLDTVAFLNLTGGTGLFDATTSFNFFGPVFFTGSLSAPTFVLGSGTGVTDQDNNVYSYDLTSSSKVSATPEPSSLVLLGTGALGLFGSFRRRFVA